MPAKGELGLAEGESDGEALGDADGIADGLTEGVADGELQGRAWLADGDSLGLAQLVSAPPQRQWGHVHNRSRRMQWVRCLN